MFKIQRFQDLDELFPSSCRAFCSILLQIYTSLADQLTRGFQSADDQFQALQTQVAEGFQSTDFRLQEQEAEVAQIQINVRNTIRHLMLED
jgi:hypothetical protein